MSKMTDEQIKKALECCGKNVLYENCGDCPYEKDFGKDHICTIKVAKDVLDLINRQQADIEDYRRNVKQLTETLTGGNGLRIRVDNMIVYADDLEEWLEFCDKQKAEAIKEFAERLKEKTYRPNPYPYIEILTKEDIDSLVKEMVGETDV